LSEARVVLLAFGVSLAGGCGAPQALRAAPVAEASAATAPPAASPAVLKACGSHADFGAQYGTSWVEDRKQQLCCSPRTEGKGPDAGVWHFVAPEECVSRYAPGLILPFVEVLDAATTQAEAARAKDCLPGVAVELVFPTAELEARIDSGSRLRIESCVGPNCAQAVIEFDSLARDDRLLFALDGSSKAGAILVWSSGLVRFRLRVAQPREQVVEGQRYRLTLELDGKPLRTIDTALAYQSSGTSAGSGSASSPSPRCPIADVRSLPP